MSNKAFVAVSIMYDTNGIVTPKKITWSSGKEYVIERVIHVCHVSPGIIKYVVSIGGLQKNLYNEDTRWYVETAG